MQQDLFKKLGYFIAEIYQLIRSPVFILLTFVGNGMIALSGAIFYYLESELRPDMLVIDAIWWSFATATTTGYGDITPQTPMGKVLGIMTMLGGTAIFAMYTGLFAETILTSERLSRKIKSSH
jgi:voltage-gated potassium channel